MGSLPPYIQLISAICACPKGHLPDWPFNPKQQQPLTYFQKFVRKLSSILKGQCHGEFHAFLGNKLS